MEAIALLLFQVFIASPIRDMAVRAEVMDVREKWIFTEPRNFLQDLRHLGDSCERFHDKPRLCELDHFPSLEQCEVAILHNRAFKEFCDQRRVCRLHESEFWLDATEACNAAYSIWDHLRDARRDYSWTQHRRLALHKLRELLGESDFHAGRMPDPAPLSFFAEVK